MSAVVNKVSLHLNYHHRCVTDRQQRSTLWYHHNNYNLDVTFNIAQRLNDTFMAALSSYWSIWHIAILRVKHHAAIGAHGAASYT